MTQLINKVEFITGTIINFSINFANNSFVPAQDLQCLKGNHSDSISPSRNPYKRPSNGNFT